MGEQIDVRKVEIINISGIPHVQIDLWFPERNTGGRCFISVENFNGMIHGQPAVPTKTTTEIRYSWAPGGMVPCNDGPFVRKYI